MAHRSSERSKKLRLHKNGASTRRVADQTSLVRTDLSMKLFQFITTHHLAAITACIASATAFAQNPPAGRGFAGRGQGMGTGTGMQVYDRVYRPGVALPMGAGNVMDANNRVGSFGSNGPGAERIDYAARNFVVTNSVPGGRGFRGSVGYGAAGDFAAATGSDSTYQFRAASAFSNPAFIQAGLTNDRFLIGQGLGVFEYRRDSTPIGVGELLAAEAQPEGRLRLDRMNTALSIGQRSWDSSEDRLVASGATPADGNVNFTLSALRGMQMSRLSDPLNAAGLPLFEVARLRSDFKLGLTTPRELFPQFNNNAVSTLPGVGPVTVEMNADLAAMKFSPRSYNEILTTIVQAYENDPTKTISADPAALKRIREHLAELRGELRKGSDATPAPESAPTLPRDPTDTTAAPIPAPTDPLPENTTTPENAIQPPKLPGDAPYPTGELPDKLKPPASVKLSIPELARILRHGKRVDELAAGDRMRVDELVRQGEAKLRAEEYFSAEDLFMQSQMIAAENPFAEAGIANAQLGAGLYLSASLTLRNLFASNPELIDTTYDRALLPSDVRMDTAVKSLRERIALRADASEYGLTLAYVGKQLGQPAIIREGLAEITGNPQRDIIRELLTEIWLADRTVAPAPITPSTEPTK